MDASIGQRRSGWLLTGLFCVVLLALFPWTSQPTGHVKVFLIACGAAAILSGWAVGGAHPAWGRILREPFALAWTGLLLFNAIGIGFSPNPAYSAVKFVQLASLYVVFIAAALAFRSPGQVWGFFRGACGAAAVVSLYGFAQYAGLDPFPWDPAVVEKYDFLKQAPSTLGNPNVASHVLVLVTIFALGLLVRTRNVLYAIVAAIFLGHFALTQTRGSLAALGAAGVFAGCLWISNRRAARVALLTEPRPPMGLEEKISTLDVTAARTEPRPPMVPVLVPVALMVLILIAIVGAVAVWLNVREGRPFPFDDSMRFRYHAYDGAARMVQDRPWFGSGPGSFEIRSPGYWTEHEQRVYAERSAYNDHVHNEPLEMAVEGGLAGGALYVALLILGIVGGIRVAWKGDEYRVLGHWIAVFFLAFLVDGVFGFNAHVPVSGLLLSIVSGALAGLGGMASERQARLPGRFVYAVGAVVVVAAAVSVFVGEIFAQRGRGAAAYHANEEALRSFEAAARLMPYDWNAEYLAGQTAVAMGDSEGAATHYARATRLHPNYVPAWIGLARAELSKASRGDDVATGLNRAMDAAERARTLSPYSAESYDLVGRVHALNAGKFGDAAAWEAAAEALGRSVELDRHATAATWGLLAQARGSLGDFAGAEEALSESISRAGETSVNWGPWLQFARQTGRFEGLLDGTNAAIRRAYREGKLGGAGFVSASLAKAEGLSEGGYGWGAVSEVYVYALRQQPVNVAVWKAFHARAVDAGQMDALRAALGNVRVAADGAAGIEAELIRRLSLVAGDADGNESAQSIAELNALVMAGSVNRDDTVWAALAMRDLVEGVEDEAARARIQTGLGTLMSNLGEFETAVAMYREAAESASGADLAQCLVGEASALLQLKRYEEALKAATKALGIAPNDISVKWAYAATLAGAGRTAEARLEYAALLGVPGLPPEVRLRIENEMVQLPVR